MHVGVTGQRLALDSKPRRHQLSAPWEWQGTPRFSLRPRSAADSDCMHHPLSTALVEPLLDLPVRAVDLPGRGSRPAELSEVGLDDCVAAVLDEADSAGFKRFALVGHSVGGRRLPRRPTKTASGSQIWSTSAPSSHPRAPVRRRS